MSTITLIGFNHVFPKDYKSYSKIEDFPADFTLFEYIEDYDGIKGVFALTFIKNNQFMTIMKGETGTRCLGAEKFEQLAKIVASKM